MFGVGVQEMVLIGLLFLVIFGPNKLPQMARDLGRFVNEARRAVEEFKDDLMLDEEGGWKPEDHQELEENLRRKEVAVVDRSTGPTE